MRSPFKSWSRLDYLTALLIPVALALLAIFGEPNEAHVYGDAAADCGRCWSVE